MTLSDFIRYRYTILCVMDEHKETHEAKNHGYRNRKGLNEGKFRLKRKFKMSTMYLMGKSAVVCRKVYISDSHMLNKKYRREDGCCVPSS